MKRSLFYLFPIIIFLTSAHAETREVYSIPVYYPGGTIGASSPYIIWYDKNIERDKNSNVKYRITINPDQKEIKPFIITPEIFDNNYYFYKIPFILEQEKYKYMIERLVDSKPQTSNYFSYRKYPITGEFTVNYNENSQVDDLPPQMLIKYIKLDEENRLENGYNFIFFSTAAIMDINI